jgi:histidine triad (HIT) family protein
MPDNCVFCRIVARQAPASIVAETVDALAFMDLNQVTDGHVLIIPKLHIRDVYGLNPQTTDAVFRLTVDVAKAVKAALRCDGLNLLQANEPAGQQEVFHVHVHVIARYEGDRDRIRFGWSPVISARHELDRLAETIRHQLTASS